LSGAPPTAFPELNAVLDEFVADVRKILGENFCGAYLQGSFAVGDADEHSDVDFIVVVYEDVGGEQESALAEMHRRIYLFDTPWAQHLEGSYAPKEIFRRIDPSRSPFLYLDNGATELTRDNHCNTAVVRSSLRERGVVLAGPDPKSLLDPVSAEQLRAEILGVLPEWEAWAKTPGMSRWRQPTLVLSFCRLLHTLETGRVTSKREAGQWALETLDPITFTVLRNGFRAMCSQGSALVERVAWGPVITQGRDYSVETTEDSSSAKVVILDPEVFRGKEVLLAIGG